MLILTLLLKIYKNLSLSNPDFAVMFAPNGVLLKEGQIVKRVALGATLRKIAELGADEFYEVFFLTFRVNNKSTLFRVILLKALLIPHKLMAVS